MNTPKARHFDGRRRRKGFLTVEELLAQLPESMLGYKDEVDGAFRFIKANGASHIHLNR